ncbi:hypothetical protein ACLBXM_11460 [Xanthobacteraceae bacterium A53D]
MRRSLLVLGLMMLPVAASAQTEAPKPVPPLPGLSAPAETQGRFSFTPVEGGVLKLDSQTGRVSFCSNGSGGFACVAVPDSRDAYEAEIARLQAQMDGKAPGTGSNRPTLSVPLPSQSDLDAAYGYAAGLYDRMRAYMDGTTPPNP